MGRKKIVKKDKSRKDDLDPTNDEFVQKSISFLDWVVERRKVIGSALGIVLVAWIAVIVINERSADRAQENAALLEEAFNAAMAPVMTDPNMDAEDLPELTFTSEDARSQEMLTRFDAAVSGAAGTELEGYATLAKGSALLQTGDYDGAIEVLTDCAQTQCAPELGPNVLLGLATALEAGGKVDEAKKHYKGLASSGSERMALWASFGEASLMMESDADAAKERLSKIVDDIAEQGDPSPGDYLFVQARARLLALDPDADVPALPSGMDPQMLQQLMQMQQAGAGQGVSL